jgi:hypothetical protein
MRLVTAINVGQSNAILLVLLAIQANHISSYCHWEKNKNEKAQ